MADQVTVTHTSPADNSGNALPRPPHQPVRQEPTPSLLSNVLAIIGFIILIVIIIWGLIHIATLSQPWFSSLFSSSNSTSDALVVTAPAEASSSAPMIVSWKYTPSGSGSYAFVYQCNDNLKFDTPTPGGTYTIPCGAAVKLSGGANALSLTPRLTGTSNVVETLTVIFMPDASSTKQAQGTATVTITPVKGATTPTPTTTTPKPVTPVTKPTSTTNTGGTYSSGPADFSVRILSTNVDQWGNGTVVFDIANIGGSTTGTYYFGAQLPTQSGYFYASPPQNPLHPGDHVVSTLNFTQAAPGTVTINVEPNGTLERSTANNTAQHWINGTAYTPQPQYNYSY